MATGDRGTLSTTVQFMNGEEFTRLVKIMGGIGAATEMLQCPEDTIQTHMQEGKLLHGEEWRRQTSPEQVQAIMDGMGLTAEGFAEELGLSLDAANIMLGFKLGM